MIEMLLVIAMTSLIVGTVGAVYIYTAERLRYGYADYRTQREAEYGLDVVDSTISRAQTCVLTAANGASCLKCTMPASCSDNNGDGILDACQPASINRRSYERWGNGYRVWFFLSDTTGAVGNAGSTLWMAKRLDDLAPTAGDLVQSFTYYPGNTKLRIGLIQSLTPSTTSNSNQLTAVIKVGAYANQSGGPAPSSASTSTSYQLSISRSPYMHGWRQ